MTRSVRKMLENVDFEKLNPMVSCSVVEAKKAQDQDVFLYVGFTKSGKTTTLYNLLKIPLEKRPDSLGVGIYVKDKSLEIHGGIGHTQRSETVYSRVVVKNGIAHCDCPGFGDNRDRIDPNIEEKTCSALGLPLVVHYARKLAGLLVHFDVRMLEERRADSFEEFLAALSGFFHYSEATSQKALDAYSLLILTHMSEEDKKIKIKRSLSKKITSKKRDIHNHFLEAKKRLNQLSIDVPAIKSALNSVKTLEHAKELFQELEIKLKGVPISQSDRGSIDQFYNQLNAFGREKEALSILRFLDKKLNSAYVLSDGRHDDREELLVKMDALKEATGIPKECFSFDRSRSDEWAVLDELMSKVSGDAYELTEQLKEMLADQPRFEKVTQLLSRHDASYQAIQPKLANTSTTAAALKTASAQLKSMHQKLSEMNADLVREGVVQETFLEKSLASIDTVDPVEYHPKSLGPVSMNVPVAQKVAYGALGVLTGSVTLVVIPLTLFVALAAWILTNKQEAARSVTRVGTGLLYATIQGASFYKRTLRYRGRPFLSYKANHEVAKPGFKVDLSEMGGSESNICFDERTLQVDPEAGVLKATCVSWGVMHAGEASITLMVESRRHPDNMPKINLLKRAIANQDKSANTVLCDMLRKRIIVLNGDLDLLATNGDPSSFKGKIAQYLNNRLRDTPELCQGLTEAEEGLRDRMNAALVERTSHEPRLAMIRELLPVIDVDTFVKRFLDEDHAALLQKVTLLLPEGGGASKEPEEVTLKGRSYSF